MIRARLIRTATAAAGALLIAACGQAGHTAAGAFSPSRADAAPTAGQASSPAASAGPASTAPAAGVTNAATSTPTPEPSPTGPSPTGPSPTPTATTCAGLAKHTFVYLTAVKAGSGGALTLTGNPATLVCGGPDDLHYNVGKSTETGHLLAGASIMVFPAPPMRVVAIRPARLGAYLATDEDTRIFLVTGPLSQITALQEQYHP